MRIFDISGPIWDLKHQNSAFDLVSDHNFAMNSRHIAKLEFLVSGDLQKLVILFFRNTIKDIYTSTTKVWLIPKQTVQYVKHNIASTVPYPTRIRTLMCEHVLQ